MEDKILSKEYVIKNGKTFGDDMGYGGDEYDSFIVEYDENNHEHLFTGIIYDCYENGNLSSYCIVKNGIKNGDLVYFYPNGQVKAIRQIVDNAAEGIQKEFYENGALKRVENRVLGRLESFINYDEYGKIIEEKKGLLSLTNVEQKDGE